MSKIRISTVAMVLLFVALTVASCEEEHVAKPVKSDNPTYDVQRLFTVDGVTVYRFWDGQGDYVYFTNGNGIVQYTSSENVGRAQFAKRHTTMCNSKRHGKD